MSTGGDYTEGMSQIEVSPGGVGYIRTPVVSVPGVPETARRQTWLVDGSVDAKSETRVTRRDGLGRSRKVR